MKALAPRTKEIPRLTREVSVVPGSVNEEAREIDVVWTTGAEVRRFDWWTGEVWLERLSMDPKHVDLRRLNSGAPVLWDHDPRKQIGCVVRGSARIEGGRGLARLRFSKRDEVTPLWQDISGGIREKFSVGYDVLKYEEEYRDGALYSRRAVDWEPAELSTVAMPADIGAEVMRQKRGAAAPTHPCAFVIRSGTPMPSALKTRMTSDEKVSAIVEILTAAGLDEEKAKSAAMEVVLKLQDADSGEAAPAEEPGGMADEPAAAAGDVVEAARAATGLKKGASVQEIVGALRGLKDNSAQLRALTSDLAEVKALEGRRLLDAAVKTRAEGGTGQISPASRKFWEGELAQPGGLARLRGFLATAAPVDPDPQIEAPGPKTGPEGKTSSPKTGGTRALTAEEREVCRQLGLSEADYLKSAPAQA